jgi:hypothetical protein
VADEKISTFSIQSSNNYAYAAKIGSLSKMAPFIMLNISILINGTASNEYFYRL